MDKLKKIVMIGPVYPYKGGIAHYTGLMCKAFRKKYTVKMVSYKMQYPKLLFKKEQKDYSNDAFKIKNTRYWINTANPLNCLKVAKRIKDYKPDLVIFQWWHPYFAPCYWLMEKMLGKDIKKLFLCHNVFPHERFPLAKLLTALVLKNGNYFITQSKMDAQDLLSVKDDAKYKQTVLPTFKAFKLTDMSKHDARKILGIEENEKILLFFGFVRPYKGLKHMLNAMPAIKEHLSDVKLYVVGDFDNDKDSYLELIHDNGIEKDVCIFDGYIPDKEVEKFFAAADLVVLPYESATQSGIVQIAYGFNKPVVVTRVGGLPEVVEDGKTGYVVDSKNRAAMSDAIIRFFNDNMAEEFERNIIAQSYKYSWDRLVEVVEELYDA